MHNAPSVSFPVGRFVWGFRGLALVSLIMAFIALVIAWPTAYRVEWAVLIALAMAGQLAAIGYKMSKEPSGHLSWSTSTVKEKEGIWTWRSDGPNQRPMAVELSLILTLKDHMLLVIRPKNCPSRLLCLSRAHAPQRWLSMRQAVWSCGAFEPRQPL